MLPGVATVLGVNPSGLVLSVALKPGTLATLPMLVVEDPYLCSPGGGLDLGARRSSAGPFAKYRDEDVGPGLGGIGVRSLDELEVCCRMNLMGGGSKELPFAVEEDEYDAALDLVPSLMIGPTGGKLTLILGEAMDLASKGEFALIGANV